METLEKYVEILPGNWNYNSAIIGFLQSMEEVEKLDVESFIQNDGRILIPRNVFCKLHPQERYFDENKISSIVAKAPIYRNYLQASEKKNFPEFIKALSFVTLSNDNCCICNHGYTLAQKEISLLRQNGLSKFIDRIVDYNMIFNANLGPSINEFPNAYWNTKQSGKVCSLCAFLLIHQHIGMSRMEDRSDIFINAPSFQLMFWLNKFLKESLSNKSSNFKDKRSLLALSVIDFTLKSKIILGQWSSMNIEIIVQKNKQIEFHSLSSNTISLLSNKHIASILSSIGEFKILNMVLSGNYNGLINLGYNLLKMSFKDQNSADRDFINDNLYVFENRKYLKLTANKLLKLYALIEDQIKTN